MSSEIIFNPKWNYKNRQAYIDSLKSGEFDLIIVGGGMTGAGIAREASLRGIKTALVDKDDFAFGTSSRSTKLAHGGFRYLQQGEFKIVRESTTERNWIRNHFPNIVRPVAFNFGIFKGSSLPPFALKIGIWLYDLLSNAFSKFKNYGKHRFIKPEEFHKEEPTYKKDGLKLVGQYYDTNIDDARITMEAIKECVARGNLTALNYAKVEGYIKKDGLIKGIKVTDQIDFEKFEIKGKQVVNATGIWTDELLENYPRKVIRPTKGVHVIVRRDKIKNESAFGLRSIDDRRVFFILPREDFTVIGTTDTDYKKDLDTPWCNKEDCDYLFKSVNYWFPDINLTYDDIISTYAGIRPLVRDPSAKDESDVSRKHEIFDTPDGLTTITGGKLTIWRLMGEQLLYHLIKDKEIFDQEFSKEELKKGYSKQPMLIGLEREEWDDFVKKEKPKIDKDILDHLYQQYGKGAFEIVKNIISNPQLGKRFIKENVFVPAEIHYILKYEFAPRLLDVLLRRTEIQLKVHHSKQRKIAEAVAWIMAETYTWDKKKKEKEINDYLKYIKNTIWF
ncbi:MAG: FAD-dependent oxidoreductase [Candidatus Lokiarchaeota archaeon]|nr:FAD-dependent oxidoreductase [Candidatus Lokiarchaeota archaeon]